MSSSHSEEILTADDIRNLCRSLGYPLNGNIQDQINIIRNRLGFRGVVTRLNFEPDEILAICRIYNIVNPIISVNETPVLPELVNSSTQPTIKSTINPTINSGASSPKNIENKELGSQSWIAQLRSKISQGVVSPSYVSSKLMGLPISSSQTINTFLSPIISLQLAKPEPIVSELTSEEYKKICLILQIPLNAGSIDKSFYISKIREYLSYVASN